MRSDCLLGLAAGMALALPAQATPHHLIWVELCDAAHPGRRVPLPGRGDDAPLKACHASCAAAPGRRAARGR